MSDRWLSIDDAAKRVGRSASTIRRYVRRDGLTLRVGMVRESELLEAEAAARRRMDEGRAAPGPVSLEAIAEEFVAAHGLDAAAARMLAEFARHAERETLARARARA